MSTERLVRKAQDGDKEAFLSLMKESELAMYRAAKEVHHREADVEDAVQETVLRETGIMLECEVKRMGEE